MTRCLPAVANKGDSRAFAKAMQTAVEEVDVDEKTLYEGMRARIKTEYAESRIDRNTATAYIVKYGDKTNDEAYWIVEGWDYEGTDENDTFGKYDKLATAVYAVRVTTRRQGASCARRGR